MTLKLPVKGLHRLHNKSQDVAKVQVIVGPYDELEVSADVAAQLKAASSAFDDGPAPDVPKEWLPEEDTETKPKPVKKATKKATAAKKVTDAQG